MSHRLAALIVSFERARSRHTNVIKLLTGKSKLPQLSELSRSGLPSILGLARGAKCPKHGVERLANQVLARPVVEECYA